MSVILSAASSFIINTISHLGYGGIMLLMGIESANIPLPSEVIMPFSGFLVSSGQFGLWQIATAGALGCLIGSLFSYYIGAVGGRPFIEKYGKYVLISHHDLDSADKWFARWGEMATFIGRLLPIIRTFISFPAGISKINIWKFALYTFVGSWIWSYFLGYIGMKLGDNWETLKTYFHGADTLIEILIILGLVLYIWRHIKNSRLKS